MAGGSRIRELFARLTDATRRAVDEMLDRAEAAQKAAEEGEADGREMEHTRGQSDAYRRSAELLMEELGEAEGERE